MKRPMLVLLFLLSIFVSNSTSIFSPNTASAVESFKCPNGVTVIVAPGEKPGSRCTSAQAGCKLRSSVTFLGLPTWYKYLPGRDVPVSQGGGCVPQLDCSGSTVSNTCYSRDGVQVADLAKFWLIGLAILELLLRLSGIVAVFIVVYGGFKYILSQGNPEATKGARQTIINALIGIAITITATISVNFIAKLIQ